MGLRFLLCNALLVSVLAVSTSGSSYHPPLPLSAAPPSTLGSYQPPIALSRSVDHAPQESNYGSPHSYSVVYTPPDNGKNRPTGYQQPANALPTSYREPPHSAAAKSLPTSYSGGSYQHPVNNVATSYSVHQQPSSVERTYGPVSSPQAIHKAPASEIQPQKSPLAKDKDNKNDEYVVYYYYYYDNDTASGGNNRSLGFDDIPSLESYDADAAKSGRQLEPEKSGNDLDAKRDPPHGSSQARSVSGSTSRGDESLVQPLRPVPNVFRYGSNEVPRFPVLPNFVVSDALPPTEPTPREASPMTTPSISSLEIDDDLNNHVLDTNEAVPQTNPPTSSTVTTTVEPTTTSTTEVPTTNPPTTTERPRRRPPTGGRRRFNPTPSSSSRTRPTSSSTTSTTETSARVSPSGGRFQGNRLRPRPPSGFGRSRTVSRTTEEDESSSTDSSSLSTSSTTPSSRGRFSTSQAPRRFQSSRSRSQTSSSSTTSTSSTTRTPRVRTTSRPRPNLVGRNRPPRPGFPRPRPEPETTPQPTEATEPASEDESVPTSVEDDGEEAEGAAEEEETEAPATTTEASRFSALFRPRNRANRPRPPLLGNRPPRS